MSASPTILVTGANGQLGSELRELSRSLPQYNFLFTDRKTLPINNAASVNAYFRNHQIDFCINCAAYTAVDKAESERDKAFEINCTAAGQLAKHCFINTTRLIHISTDYVYSGVGTTPLKEGDATNPANIYGQSKLAGEQLVIENNPDAVIVRTSWLYSSFGHNFLKTMIRLLRDREEIRVINDQQGTPTYAAHLAKALISMIDKIIGGKEVKGVYNFSNSGHTTWFGFAQKIKETIGSTCRIIPISTEEYPTPATRPAYSVLDTTKIRQLIHQDIPDWQQGVSECIGLES